MDFNAQTWVLCHHITPDSVPSQSLPTVENAPLTRRKRGKNKRTRFTTRKKRAPHVKARVALYRQQLQQRRNSERKEDEAGRKSPDDMVSVHRRQNKRKQNFRRILPSPPQGAYGIEALQPDFTYLYRIRQNTFEPSEILPDTPPDQLSSVVIQSMSVDEESNVSSAENFYIRPKEEIIEETSYEAHFHEEAEELNNASVKSELILPLSPQETESTLSATSPRSELSFQSTSPNTKSLLEEDLLKANLVHEKSPEAKLVLVETPSEAHLSFEETQPAAQLVLPETSSEPHLSFEETQPAAQLVLPETPSEAHLTFKETQPAAQLVRQETQNGADLTFQETEPATQLVLKKTPDEAALFLKDLPRGGYVLQKGPSEAELALEITPDAAVVSRKTSSKTTLVFQNIVPSVQVPPLHYTESPKGLIESVLSELKHKLPFPWLALAEVDGIHVLLFSRLREKAIQRRVFFSYIGKEELTVHRKPIPTFISHDILQDEVCEAVALTRGRRKAFVNRVLDVIERFRAYEICRGIDDPALKHLWRTREDGDIDRNWYGELRYKETFRPSDCDLLVPTIPMLKRCCSVCFKQLIKSRTFRDGSEGKLDASTSKLDSDDVQRLDASNSKSDSNHRKLLRKVRMLEMELQQARSQVVMLLKESEDMNEAAELS